MGLPRIFIGILLLSTVIFANEAGRDEESEKLSREALEKVMQSISAECSDEMKKSMKDPSKISEKCTKEIQLKLADVMGSTAQEFLSKGKTKDSKKDSSEKTDKGSSRKSTDRKGPIAIVMGFVLASMFGMIGVCWYLNQRINEAGLHKNLNKKLSKKKIEKERRKNSRNATID